MGNAEYIGDDSFLQRESVEHEEYIWCKLSMASYDQSAKTFTDTGECADVSESAKESKVLVQQTFIAGEEVWVNLLPSCCFTQAKVSTTDDGSPVAFDLCGGDGNPSVGSNINGEYSSSDYFGQCYARFVMPAADVTVYAQGIKTEGYYSVIYEANGGVLNSKSSTFAKCCTGNSADEIAASLVTVYWPTRTGYDFKGWSISNIRSIVDFTNIRNIANIWYGDDLNNLTKYTQLKLAMGKAKPHPSRLRRATFLAAARSPSGSDSPLGCHSTPLGRYATPPSFAGYGEGYASGNRWCYRSQRTRRSRELQAVPRSPTQQSWLAFPNGGRWQRPHGR